MDMKIVDEGVIEVRYTIRQWGENMFDWILSNGQDSESWFDTADEALVDLDGNY